MFYNRARSHAHFIMDDGDHSQLRRIITEILPKVVQKFANKSVSYGDRGYPLGPAGQFPEVKRKVDMLQRLLWDQRGEAEAFDSADDLCDDLIGHLLMTKDCLAQQRAGYPKLDMPPMVTDDAAAHRIRESKGGPETWTEPPGVSAPYARGAAVVGEVVRDTWGLTRTLVQVGGHILRMARESEQRCQWVEGATPNSADRQCVGIDGHGHHPVRVGRDTTLAEDHHINDLMHAWPI